MYTTLIMGVLNFDKKISKEVTNRIQNDVNNGAKHYNTVYRQASTNLLVVAGILLALCTALVGQLDGAALWLKILTVCVIAALTGSLAFGVIQQLIEAEYFRKDAIRKIKLSKTIAVESITDNAYIWGRLDEIDERKGHAVTRWASIVQLCLLGVALLIILAIVILFLFS